MPQSPKGNASFFTQFFCLNAFALAINVQLCVYSGYGYRSCRLQRKGPWLGEVNPYFQCVQSIVYLLLNASPNWLHYVLYRYGSEAFPHEWIRPTFTVSYGRNSWLYWITRSSSGNTRAVLRRCRRIKDTDVEFLIEASVIRNELGHVREYLGIMA